MKISVNYSGYNLCFEGWVLMQENETENVLLNLFSKYYEKIFLCISPFNGNNKQYFNVNSIEGGTINFHN